MRSTALAMDMFVPSFAFLFPGFHQFSRSTQTISCRVASATSPRLRVSAATRIISAARPPNRASLPERLQVADQDRSVHQRDEMRTRPSGKGDRLREREGKVGGRA